ncbi:hypothetical protein RR46_14561 [Papilio xuthus]|uniref:Uncharacterized protein n=1 Tax=Papilio xuthus TaxID=66420 RepID=A0A194PCV4_PAPXU|nr:hypothetical protein RR46_14561 [Papilio xuthus]
MEERRGPPGGGGFSLPRLKVPDAGGTICALRSCKSSEAHINSGRAPTVCGASGPYTLYGSETLALRGTYVARVEGGHSVTGSHRQRSDVGMWSPRRPGRLWRWRAQARRRPPPAPLPSPAPRNYFWARSFLSSNVGSSGF